MTAKSSVDEYSVMRKIVTNGRLHSQRVGKGHVREVEI